MESLTGILTRMHAENRAQPHHEQLRACNTTLKGALDVGELAALSPGARSLLRAVMLEHDRIADELADAAESARPRTQREREGCPTRLRLMVTNPTGNAGLEKTLAVTEFNGAVWRPGGNDAA